MKDLINNCLIACDVQHRLCIKTRCTNSHEWPIFSCASDLVEFFLKDKIDAIKSLSASEREELINAIDADDRFETFTSALDDYPE